MSLIFFSYDTNKKTSHQSYRSCLLRLLTVFCFAFIADASLAASGTLNFTSNSGISGSVATDGQGGSTDLSGIVIQIRNISDTNGTDLGVNMEWRNNADLGVPDGGFTGLTTFSSPSGNAWKGMSIKSSDGSEFQINQFKWHDWNYAGGTVNVTGYRDGSSVSSTSFTANSTSAVVTVNLGSDFDNVDEVRITYASGDSYPSMNNIVIDDAALPAPTITSATYNASTGALVVTGTDFTATSGATNDVVANKFTLTGEGGSTYTLTDTANVEISSATSFTLTLSATDRAAVNSQITNKNGTSSTSSTTYNLAGAAGFVAASAATADTTGNGITASNVAVPTITSATYNASTGALVVTGTGFLKLNGATNDIVANKFTLTGEGGSTYTLTDTSNVEITSGTSFTLTLSATDRAGVNLNINKNGTSSTGGTTYNLAAAEDWAVGADGAVAVADLTGNGVTVSSVPVPTITSATYDASSGVLVVTGTGFLKLSGATNDIDISKLTFTGEGGSTYTLTTSSVEVTSGTSFSVTLNATDLAAVNQIINKNGTSSTGGTTYNLAAAEDWAAGANSAVVVADLTGNGITVSNVAVPTITSATYDASTFTFTVTGTGFLKLSGATNDIAGTKFSFRGEGGSGATYTFVDTPSVEITSGTSFTLVLGTADRDAVNLRADKTGTSSVSGTTYLLNALEDWAAGADAAVVTIDSSNTVTVSNVAIPTITSATYNAGTGVLAVTGTNFLSRSGSANDIDITKLSITGDSTEYFLTTSNVDVTSTTSFSVTLNGTDQSALTTRLNKNGTSSIGTVTYNLIAAEDWARGADSAVVVADLTGNGITVSNVNTTPAIANLNGDSVSWAGVGSTVVLDTSTNTSLTDSEFGALNGGNGDWSSGSLTVQRSGTAITADTFGFNTSGALFTFTGTTSGNLQSGGLTFATYTNTNGVLSISFTSSGTTATTALVNDIAQRITYRNDTPSGDATVRFNLSDGSTSTTADVTVTTNTIFVTNSTDTATIDITNGVSFSEAIGIAAADATGSQTIAFASSLAATALTVNSVSLNESLTFDMDAASGMSLTTGTIAIGSNTLIITNGTGDTASISSALSGSAGLAKTGAGTLTLSNTGNEAGLSGGMTISGGTVGISDDDQMAAGTLTLNGGTLSLNGPTIFDNAINLAASSTLNAGGNAIASGVISGAGDLTKTGSLSLQLVGSNTYTGATTVSNGYLLANNANSLGTTAGGTTVASGATLYLSGSFTLAEALSLTGTGMLGNGAIYAPSGNSTLSGQVTLTGNTTIIHDGDLTFSGGITDGAGSYNFSKEGTGTLTLSGTASYDGTTTLSSGGLSIGSDSHLGSGALTLATGTTFAVTGATTIDNGIVLSGNATVSNSASVTLSGVISSTGSLVKTGASALTLSGINTYSGTTTVSGGSLSITGSTTSATTVASGGTLIGTGTLSGAVTVQSGGTLAPGISGPAIFNLGGLTVQSGGTLAVDIAGSNAGSGYDILTVNGSVDVSSATLAVTHSYTAGSGDAYLIISNDASDAITGNFSGLSEGGTVTASGNSTPLTVSYIGNTGNDFTLTAPTFPVVSSVSASTVNGTYKIGDTISITVTFDMTVFVNTAGGTPTLQIETGTTDRTLNYVSGSGGSTLTFNYTVQAGDVSADLDYVSTSALALNGGTIQDALNHNATLTLATPGAAGSLGANKAIVIDGVRPTATIVVADTALATGETSLVTITFSEAATGFTTADLTAANGALSSLSTGDGGVTWTATFTPTASITDTTNIITLDNTGVTDAAGNAGTGATDSNNYAIDTARPTATLVVADTALATGETSLVTITFSEAVTGFTNADLTIPNGTLTAVSSGDGGVTWAATLTPTASTTDATNVITLDNTGVTDAAGNAGTGTTDSNNYAIDTARPTATIVVADTSLTVSETSLVTITFSEAATGFTNADLTIANGTLTAVSSGDGGVTWTATLTPTTSTTDATNIITLDNTGVTDASGNAGTGTTDSNNYAVDTELPNAVTDFTATATNSTVALSWTNPVADFDSVSIRRSSSSFPTTVNSDTAVVSNSTATTLNDTSLADGTYYYAIFAFDAAGNVSVAATASATVDTVGITAPTIVVADTSLAAGEASLVTITFSEAVTGFTNADLTIANGTLTAVSSGDGGVTWTATLTPTASITDATNVITLNNTGVTDAAGNAGTGTTDSNNYAIDNVRPIATIVVADTSLTASETSLVTITFNEAVTGFTNADLTIANGTLTAVSSSDGGVTWAATLTPTASITDATNVITLNNTGVADAAGNAGTGTTDSNNYAIDTTRPTTTIVVADASLTIGETSLVTITFSEAVTGFTNADLTIQNGTLTAVSSGNGGVTWTATLTPTASISDATNVITLNNTGVTDSAGNAGTGTTDSNNYAIDSTRPTATIVVADTSLSAGETSLVTITFNEAVTGFTNADLTIANGTLSAVSSGDGGVTWAATLTPTASITDTTNVITLANTGVTDAAGNAGTGTTDSNNYAIDNVRPIATIVVADTSLTASETSLVTITFNEAVTGFTNADLTIANGTLSAVTSGDGGTTWTATLTPTASITDATNVITFDNTGVTDSAGNAGTGTTDSNNYAIDTGVPVDPMVSTPVSAVLTNDTSYAITGVHMEEGVTVNMYADADNNGVADSTTALVTGTVTGGSWSVTAALTADTANNFVVIAKDAAGNSSSAVDVPTITQDSTAPVAPASLDLATASDTGASNTDDITNVTTPIITGTSEANATVTLTSSLTGAVGTATADGSGTWSITTSALSQGVHNLTATASDAAFNVSPASSALVVTVDTAVPSISAVANQNLVGGANTGALPVTLGDNLTAPAALVLTSVSSNLTAVPLANITLGGAAADRTVTVTAQDSGTSTITLTVQDQAGNSANTSFTVAVNSAPTISGTPMTSLDQNTDYSFVPTASDVDVMDTLTFSITNKPSWASFDTATGTLTGIPDRADIGITSGIVISVSDGNLSTSLPAFAIEVLSTANPLAPVLTVPANIQLNADALYTKVNLRRLLGLANNASQQVLDAALKNLATDSTSGTDCCNARPDGVDAQGNLFLAPGRNNIIWKATNAAGLSVEEIQQVDIHPIVSFAKSQTVVRGGTAEVKVILNGIAPTYPLSIPILIDPATSAAGSEYVLTSTIASFTEIGQRDASVSVQLTTVSGINDSELVLGFAASGVNAGSENRHTMSIRQGNVAPKVKLQISQAGVNTNLITPSGGVVTVTAMVTDPNTADTHSFDWSASDSSLTDTDGNATNATFQFSPVGLSGAHQVQVTVTDTANATGQTQSYFLVTSSLPILNAADDTDGDGIDDVTEGITDANENGIPDYRDSATSTNLLPQVRLIPDAYLLECDPGVRCGLGQFSLLAASGGAQLLGLNETNIPGILVDPTHIPVGGIFDFTVSDLPKVGESVRIVVPQQTPIPANPVYRKYQNGSWRTFVENGTNTLHSAVGEPGYCPPPGDSAWVPGLVPGSHCVQLTIQDGGANDADGKINGTVVDPGVVSKPKPSPVVVVPPTEPPVTEPVVGRSSTKKSSGAINEWLLVLLGLIALGRLISARRRS